MLPELDAAKAAEGKQNTWLSDAWAGKGNGITGPDDVDSSLRCEKSGICEGIASCKAGTFPFFSRAWPATVGLLPLSLIGPAVKHDCRVKRRHRLVVQQLQDVCLRETFIRSSANPVIQATLNHDQPRPLPVTLFPRAGLADTLGCITNNAKRQEAVQEAARWSWEAYK